MKLKDMFEAVNLLDTEWDMGKTPSKSKGKICAWIYLLSILEESDFITTRYNNNKLIGFCGYAKWLSKKHVLKKMVYHLLRRVMMLSPKIKVKYEIEKYDNKYNYVPENLKNYFDGEISITILNGRYRGRGIGKEMLLEVFEHAKIDNVKKLQILTDEACNFKFYEICGCKKIYETVINGGEPIVGKTSMGYIYEKQL